MADAWSGAGRSEQRDDGSSAWSNWRADGGLFRYVARPVRPYRLVARYRGDRLGRDADLGAWGRLWRLRAGDVSWPGDRRS